MKLKTKDGFSLVSSQLPNGKYKTVNGSTLEISGKYGGIAKVDFDWLEEGACIDCQCEPYPEKFDDGDWRLIWNCKYCGGGNARLQSAN